MYGYVCVCERARIRYVNHPGRYSSFTPKRLFEYAVMSKTFWCRREPLRIASIPANNDYFESNEALITDIASHEPSRPASEHSAQLHTFCGTVSFLLMKAAVTNAHLFIIYTIKKSIYQNPKLATSAQSMSKTPVFPPL